jgi:hypothetical protein
MFCRLAYLSTPTVLVAACVVGGLLEALTPLSIITGAIMLFQAMQHTKVTVGFVALRCCVQLVHAAVVCINMQAGSSYRSLAGHAAHQGKM